MSPMLVSRTVMVSNATPTASPLFSDYDVIATTSVQDTTITLPNVPVTPPVKVSVPSSKITVVVPATPVIQAVTPTESIDTQVSVNPLEGEYSNLNTQVENIISANGYFGTYGLSPTETTRASFLLALQKALKQEMMIFTGQTMSSTDYTTYSNLLIVHANQFNSEEENYQYEAAQIQAQKQATINQAQINAEQSAIADLQRQIDSLWSEYDNDTSCSNPNIGDLDAKPQSYCTQLMAQIDSLIDEKNGLINVGY